VAALLSLGQDKPSRDHGLARGLEREDVLADVDGERRPVELGRERLARRP
jgi:hypothetical protein